MTKRHPIVPPGFHEGELAVQLQAGVRADASRLRRMLDAAELGGAAPFLAGQRFAVICGRDHAGRAWVSPLTGPAGFLEATGGQTLRVHTTPVLRDPLRDLPNSQHVGLVVIDFTRGRRYRINGWLVHASGEGFTIEADQAYGNCPQYIQRRDLIPQRDSGAEFTTTDEAGLGPLSISAKALASVQATRLAAADIAQIRTADTLFLGTTHPSRGRDASHRGGPPGFVRVQNERTLWWPDYPGNNMFNSLGNLAVDPAAALLFSDFTSGRTLYLSGAARLDHIPPGTTGDDADTGRRVTFTVERARVGPPAALRAVHTTSYPRNPALTD